MTSLCGLATLRATRRSLPSLAFVLPLLAVLLARPSFAKAPASVGSASKETPAEDLQKAVLRVEVSAAGRDWSAPWKLLAPESGSASAFAIAPDRLLTNAHVVHDAQQITVKKNDGSAPAIAAVEAVDDDCDLAVLRLPDTKFLAGVHPLKLGGLPAIGSSVTTYGYPVGGLALSTTAGIVSRLDTVHYGQGISAHLAGQTDAAINPGNSGGPVVQGGVVVGVAFQVLRFEQNIGYFIPAPVVRHFLDDLAGGHYAGFPDVPAAFSHLESNAARRERGLPADRSGVIVEAIENGSDLEGVLAPGDVVLSIGGERVSDDGTFAAGETRLPFSHLVDMKSLGQPVRFEVWRGGKVVPVEWRASRYPLWDQLRKAQAGTRYLVYGGLVFVPLSLAVFRSTNLPHDRLQAILRALGTLEWGHEKATDTEIVLLAKVLPDPVNEGIADETPLLLRRVNGQPVRGLADLARILDSSHAERDVFELGMHGGLMEAIDHSKANATRAAFLTSHGIGHDRSL